MSSTLRSYGNNTIREMSVDIVILGVDIAVLGVDIAILSVSIEILCVDILILRMQEKKEGATGRGRRGG